MFWIACVLVVDRCLARRVARVAIGVLLALGAAAVPADAHADAALEPAPAIDAALVAQVRSLALAAPQHGAPRVEVVVGTLDARLRLAPCRRIEPYLPPNTRLWGKSRVGLRCVDGEKPWNVYLPVTVKVYGRGLVAPAGAAAGSVLSAADLVEAEVDLAEEMTPAVTEPAQAVGRTLAQALRPGQALHQGALRIKQWFAAGETVRVVAVGEGFQLESEGQALGNGLEGQAVRVRTDSGRIVTGLPVGERRLELAP